MASSQATLKQRSGVFFFFGGGGGTGRAVVEVMYTKNEWNLKNDGILDKDG